MNADAGADPGADADVGILDGQAPDAANGNAEELPTLLAVHEALDNVSRGGRFCASGKADGSDLTPALPNTTLRINGVSGDIPLPLTELHAKAIKSSRHMTKVEDDSYHKVHSVEGGRIRIKNPAWDASLKKLVQTVAYKLGVDPDNLSAELDMMLLMEKGSWVKRCSNEEGGNVLGTLLVQLPSTFSGGKFSVYDVDGEDEEEGQDHTDSRTMSSNMGASSGESSFSCHFLSHYKDCEYEIGKVTSGHRVLLRFSLLYNGAEATPTAMLLRDSLSTLRWSLAGLPPSDRVILVPMVRKYRATSLVQHGINALSPEHRSLVETIKAATFGLGWKVRIVNAEMTHTSVTTYYRDPISSNSDSSILSIYDEEGKSVTVAESWLQSVVNFSPIDNEASVDGMLLTSNEEAAYESWGCVASYSSTEDYDGRDTTKSKYAATFILAYDATLADEELQCLSGCDGVAKVTDRVVANRNYDLLERMLAVVDAKAKSKFDVRSCQKVLQMLTRSTSKNALSSERVEFVNKTLSNLETREPDVELYDAIRAAAKKFGHNNISTSISKLLSDGPRRKGLQLSQFLLRCDFIFKLKNYQNEDGPDYLEALCRDLPTFGANLIQDTGHINSTIESMLTEHSWEPMAAVVEATLRFMHSKIGHNTTLQKLMDRALLLWKIGSHPYDFQQFLVDFAADFTTGLGSNPTFRVENILKGDQKTTFVKSVCTVMAYGTAGDFSRLGKWAARTEALLDALLKAFPKALVHGLLNKCFVQNSTTRSGWWRHGDRDRPAPTSLHVQKVLKDYPDMTSQPSEDGRLTLHYAVASKDTSYETAIDVFESYPQAASIRCPVSGLYPFMMAASNSLLGASFCLLLANPSLVTGGTQGADESSRKRKRN